MAPTYQYSPFPDTNSIRLIYLEPWRRDPDEPLRCQLRTVSLDNLPPHEAISYAWGEPIFSREILVDGGLKLGITSSLEDALQRTCWDNLRRGRLSLTRILWADAICINQQDVDERSQQVQLMREIYQDASQVLVWLGHGGPEVQIAMNLIDKIMILLVEEREQTGQFKHEYVSAEQNAMWGLPTFDSPDRLF
ncbi:Heterokaryon incompatibility protein 6,OR allele [Lachnellula subtilissima]|uniref:Heterokaryon incompatibility protein 6,OR allele n=1 Tax=Lachnellula subtilissima TaxID=602034 RepID=A0A8H8UA57_9HELO|nr:Heterokaryon incompatibility protein 6,OR allele [Lachnellula subtilissima]